MSDQNDGGTTVALGTAGGVVLLAITIVIGIAISRAFKEPAAAPAAPAAVVVESAELVLIEGPLAGDLVGTVYFELSAAELQPAEAAKLDAVIKAMADAPARKAVLSGFHDASGGAASNAELAKQRAIGVRKALVAAGVDAGRVGLRKPEQTTGGADADAARRVEIRLVD